MWAVNGERRRQFYVIHLFKASFPKPFDLIGLGGKIMSVKRLLSSHMSKQAINYKVQSLEKMGVRAAKAMRRKFPGVCEIGVDVGMDRTLTPWILEINTSPDPYIFRKLPDSSIFRKIKRYAKSYGRL
jgi:hypothetical protein